MKSVHVCIVSDQLIPNLIPVLMEQPDQVWLLLSGVMQRKGLGRRFERLLQQKGFQVMLREGVPDAALATIREYSLEIATDLEEEGFDRILLNATGGNKLLTLAFVDTFQSALDETVLRILYTDTRHNKLELLFPPKQNPVEMKSVLDVPLYLAAQGAKVRKVDSDQEFWSDQVRERRSVTYALAGLLKRRQDAALLGAINALSARSRETNARHQEKLVKPLQSFDEQKRIPSGRWAEMLRQFEAAGLVEWDGAYQLTFLTLDAARYLGGGWLEEYCWLVAQQSGFDDLRLGVEITWEEGASRQEKARNEFDLLAIHNNRMLVVECKTANLFRDGAKDQDVVNRIESLGRSAGGLFGSSLLLSARELKKETCNRCATQSIHYLAEVELLDLDKNLMQWKSTGGFLA